jgi:hypothetical protein
VTAPQPRQAQPGQAPSRQAPSRQAPSRQARDRVPGRLRVLVTGAGGPAAIAAMKSLRADPSVELLAADMDPWAAGLYLVPPEARTLVPAGAAPDFTVALLARCRALGVDVVLPTVDAELRPLARDRAAFALRPRDRPRGLGVPGDRQAADGQRVARRHGGGLRGGTGRA